MARNRAKLLHDEFQLLRSDLAISAIEHLLDSREAESVNGDDGRDLNQLRVERRQGVAGAEAASENHVARVACGGTRVKKTCAKMRAVGKHAVQ